MENASSLLVIARMFAARNVRYDFGFNEGAMKFSADIVNTALALSLDWGEEFMRSIHSRMKQRHPELSRQELDYLNSMCYHTVQPFAWQRFCEIHEIGLSLYQAFYAIQCEFPWISEENLDTMQQHGNYYAHRKKNAIRHSLSQTDHSWKYP